MSKKSWTDFAPFQSTKEEDYLYAPFYAGVYELMNAKTRELVYIEEGDNVSNRMSSLLPAPFGTGTRNNKGLRNYILENIQHTHYRTLACSDKQTAKRVQDEMIATNKYLFN